MVAIVLGAAVRPDGEASPTLRLRVEHAVALYHRGAVAAVCVTGGVGRHGPAEAEVAARLAMSLGVPERDVILEDRSRTTVENIAFARPLIGVHQVVLVSNRWHLPRAWVVARILGVRASVSGPRGRMSTSRTIAATLREVAALPSTVWRAWILSKRSAPKPEPRAR
ncbi:YdcF family protein [Jannaschia pagri]|uniref:YdcF family protein n=1 Tax=Jannaschia pagri TaxID=2829797 RepID=UPI001C7CA861|nr:YdcF family protein [Jannaschia sp. AI_62]